MRTQLIVSSALALTLLALDHPASALPEFTQKIPNGSCGACHVVPTATPADRNKFGQAAEAIGGSADAWWGQLASKDSDGDGQTNGQELGDPCGTWKPGGAPQRTTDISNPGSASSKAGNPGTCSSGGSTTGGGNPTGGGN